MPARKPIRAASKKAAKKSGAKPGKATKAARKPTPTAAAKQSATKRAKPKPRPTPVGSKNLPAKVRAAKSKTDGPPRGTQAPAKPAARLAGKTTRARDALNALAKKKAITATLSPAVDGKSVVDAYMRDVDHPFRAEMEAVRRIILSASPKIAERIKWNAPSFYYKEDLGAFNPRATEYAHLILLFPGGAGMQDEGGLLEGNHKDRREAKFHSVQDVNAKKPALEKLVKRWVSLRDKAS